MILTRRIKNPEHPNQPDIVVAEMVLTNIRVLAIDQAPKEKDGQNAVVGKTVTLELKPEQIGDAGRRRARPARCRWRCAASPTSTRSRATSIRTQSGDGINVIRYGVATRSTSQK